MAFFSCKLVGLVGVFALLSLSAAGAVQSTARHEEDVLSRIRRNGFVSCGISGELLGFSHKDERGEWRGFDIDYCRAVAAAIFDDPAKIRIREINIASRREELERRYVDIIVARGSATMSRETGEGLTIPAISYFDGQGILVSKRLELSDVQGLAGKAICVQKATMKADNVSEFFRDRRIFVETIGFSSGNEIFAGYERGECEAVSADMATLYSWRVMSGHPDEYTFLPDIVSKEPTGPIVLRRDHNWAEVVRWVHMALVNAEEMSITGRNVEEEYASSPRLTVRRLFGIDGKMGKAIGLDDGWAYRVIRHVGNYGEIFERNLGAASRLNIKRGQNALWSEGGLQYGIPIR